MSPTHCNAKFRVKVKKREYNSDVQYRNQCGNHHCGTSVWEPLWEPAWHIYNHYYTLLKI